MTSKKPCVVGLTGGIASGKSAAASFLREAGAPVIDADSLGHMVLAPDGGSFRAVVDRFGEDILDNEGRIDRQKLGELVFDDENGRRDLEALTHPEIGRLARRGLELIAERGDRLAFYEAALLVETGVHHGLDGLVVVACSLATQLERVVARDGLSREAAAKRIASQFPLAEKVAVANHVIENDGDLPELRERTLEVLARLRVELGLD